MRQDHDDSLHKMGIRGPGSGIRSISIQQSQSKRPMCAGACNIGADKESEHA